MPRYNTDKHRVCACGCGQPVPLFYDKTGRFKGYARGIPGHRRRQANAHLRAQRCAILARIRADRTQPLGARRLHNSGRSGLYTVIKVDHPRQWRYEHRVVMERVLGRQLQPGEHVHHRNGDTLDNRPENLELLTAGAHSRHHHVISTWSRQHPCCVRCGETHWKHATHGLCTRCHQREWRRTHPR